MRAADNHPWSWGEDVVTFYTEKFGPSLTRLSEMEIARLIGVSLNTFKMRKANFLYLISKDKGIKAGLNRPAQQSKDVYERYKNTDKPTLLKVVMEHLEEMKAPAA
jgi:hypothetical protein